MGPALGPGGEVDLQRLHAGSRRNERALPAAGLCGCFHCLRTFEPAALGEDDWCEEADGERTALCPFCGIDAVIASPPGALLEGVLDLMHERYFGNGG